MERAEDTGYDVCVLRPDEGKKKKLAGRMCRRSKVLSAIQKGMAVWLTGFTGLACVLAVKACRRELICVVLSLDAVWIGIGAGLLMAVRRRILENVTGRAGEAVILQEGRVFYCYENRVYWPQWQSLRRGKAVVVLTAPAAVFEENDRIRFEQPLWRRFYPDYRGEIPGEEDRDLSVKCFYIYDYFSPSLKEALLSASGKTS